ncbi:MAG TPA: MerR family transcriptional regulator, partial [Tissierellaceae bacterium]|nr:MerR family transcriptional regulator [Tissierellaceae bacterium]
MLDFTYEYSISEVSEITGFAPHVLRYYEKEFDIDVPRKDSNHRYYTYKEIELILYIKDLKEKEFSNKQIKMIIDSPQTVFSNEDTDLDIIRADMNTIEPNDIAVQISSIIENRFFEKLTLYLEENKHNTTDLVETLKDEIIALRQEINSKEHDVLICENAKLRMKVKEKVYENVKLKDEIARLKYANQSFFKKLFNKKNK